MATDDKKENSDEKIKKEENNNSSEKEESKETNDSKKDENNEVKNEINNSNDKLNTGEITSSKNTVLVDNDHELEVVKNVLKDIHKSFYTSYDNKETDVSVQKILKTMRHKILNGKNILFSSVIPLNQDPSK